nr:hypothetical protein CFP56_75111 [Quercus suber]
MIVHSHCSWKRHWSLSCRLCESDSISCGRRIVAFPSNVFYLITDSKTPTQATTPSACKADTLLNHFKSIRPPVADRQRLELSRVLLIATTLNPITMTRSLPYRPAMGRRDPQPRDPGNGRNAPPNRPPREPQPRDDGSHRSPYVEMSRQHGASLAREPAHPRDDGSHRIMSTLDDCQQACVSNFKGRIGRRRQREPQPRDPGT